MSKSEDQERRGNIRYPAAIYTAYAQRVYGFERFKPPHEAVIIDFNRNGICLCSDYKYRVGNKVRVQIKSPTEEITGIMGVVKYVKKQRIGYWFGVQFLYLKQDAEEARREQSVLVALEKLIKHQLG